MPLKGLTPGVSLASFPSPIPPISVGSNIKSIQRGLNTFTTTPIDITISPIVLANSVVIIKQRNVGTTGGAANKLVIALFTTPTNLRLGLSGTYDVNNQPTVSWDIIEFNNVKSKQSGSVAMSAAIVTQAVSAVNVNKSLLFTSSGSTDATNDNMLSSTHTAQITSPTQLTFGTNAALSTMTVYWQLIEFN